MSEREGFLRSIADDVYDDPTRLDSSSPTYAVRSQQWVFGWDCYGDKSGTIHAT